MIILSGPEEKKAKAYMQKAAEIAKSASCDKARCGSIIVRDGKIIGTGYNSPPADDESQRKCNAQKNDYDAKVTDKTCCVHAEQRAIMDALKNNPEKLEGSRIYFIRLDDLGNIAKAGRPYCTHCSKLALDAGIAEFALWHEEGIAVYDTKEYNKISFEYSK